MGLLGLTVGLWLLAANCFKLLFASCLIKDNKIIFAVGQDYWSGASIDLRGQWCFPDNRQGFYATSKARKKHRAANYTYQYLSLIHVGEFA